MSKRDYYEVLGVSRDASADEIRRAYRQCALKHHPDRNPGDHSAEQKFKEATEAYSVLSDEQKRAQFDRFGHVDLSGFDFSSAGMGDILSHFQDMFSDFFGGFGTSGRHRRRPERGQDVRVEAHITLKDAITGCKQEVTVKGPAPCDTCLGSGARAGSAPERCSQCNGTGQVTTHRGFIMFTTTCPRCQGGGEVITEPCESCRGAGFIERQRKVLVTFPPGIDSDQRLRVPGQGMPGPHGSACGDLYVDVGIEPDPRFERDGYNLIARQPISIVEAALGSTVSLLLPTNDPVSVEIKPGTQPETVITVKGRGVPRLDRRGRGDLLIAVEVQVPKKLSRQAKKLLLELEQELGSSGECSKASLG